LVIAVGPDEFSPTIEVGHVISQSPVAGTVVDFGTTVTVVLSKGPDLVAIPSLAGLDPNGVTTALRDAGFTLGTIDGNTSLPFKNATVAGVVVAVGQQFPRGTVVDVHYTP
jgi:serine/threonine-protein kinase